MALKELAHKPITVLSFRINPDDAFSASHESAFASSSCGKLVLYEVG